MRSSLPMKQVLINSFFSVGKDEANLAKYGFDENIMKKLLCKQNISMCTNDQHTLQQGESKKCNAKPNQTNLKDSVSPARKDETELPGNGFNNEGKRVCEQNISIYVYDEHNLQQKGNKKESQEPNTEEVISSISPAKRDVKIMIKSCLNDDGIGKDLCKQNIPVHKNDTHTLQQEESKRCNGILLQTGLVDSISFTRKEGIKATASCLSDDCIGNDKCKRNKLMYTNVEQTSKQDNNKVENNTPITTDLIDLTSPARKDEKRKIKNCCNDGARKNSPINTGMIGSISAAVENDTKINQNVYDLGENGVTKMQNILNTQSNLNHNPLLQIQQCMKDTNIKNPLTNSIVSAKKDEPNIMRTGCDDDSIIIAQKNQSSPLSVVGDHELQIRDETKGCDMMTGFTKLMSSAGKDEKDINKNGFDDEFVTKDENAHNTLIGVNENTKSQINDSKKGSSISNQLGLINLISKASKPERKMNKIDYTGNNKSDFNKKRNNLKAKMRNKVLFQLLKEHKYPNKKNVMRKINKMVNTPDPDMNYYSIDSEKRFENEERESQREVVENSNQSAQLRMNQSNEFSPLKFMLPPDQQRRKILTDTFSNKNAITPLSLSIRSCSSMIEVNEIDKCDGDDEHNNSFSTFWQENKNTARTHSASMDFDLNFEITKLEIIQRELTNSYVVSDFHLNFLATLENLFPSGICHECV